MLNPLTAHGLAGNVMQFIRFALELVTEGERVYNAAEGVLIENKDTEALTSDLQKLADGVSKSQKKWMTAHGNHQSDSDELCLLLEQRLQSPKNSNDWREAASKLFLRRGEESHASNWLCGSRATRSKSTQGSCLACEGACKIQTQEAPTSSKCWTSVPKPYSLP